MCITLVLLQNLNLNMFDFDIYAQFGYQGHEYGLVPEHHAFSTIYKMPISSQRLRHALLL